MVDFVTKPSKGVWEITLACNMNCRHCGSGGGRSLPDELSTTNALKLADDLADIGLKAITLSGGEPFLRDDWHLIAERLTCNGIVTNVITNGWLLTDDLLEKVVRSGISNILLSIDGISETHDWIRKEGSYEKNLSALELLKQHDVPVACMTTLNKKNIVDLPALKEVLVKYGASGWQLQLAMPMGNLESNLDLILSAEDIPPIITFIKKVADENEIAIYLGDNIGYHSSCGEELLRQKDDFKEQELNLCSCWSGCHAAKRIIGICANGDITGCLTLRDPSYVAGNICSQSLADIWYHSEVLQKLRNFKQEDLQGFCQTCVHGATCLGGCNAHKATFNKSIYAENPTCLYHLECNKNYRESP